MDAVVGLVPVDPEGFVATAAGGLTRCMEMSSETVATAIR
jgi:hypothetical protein